MGRNSSPNKSCDDKASQIDIVRRQHNHTMSFFTHFDFESVLYQTHIAEELTYIIAKA